MPDDRDLLNRSRAGDPAAWRELLDLYGPSMLGLARALLRHTASDGIQPEDLVQEVWTALLADGGRALRSIDERGPGPYLSVSVANAVRKHRRSARIRQERPLAPPPPEAPEEPLLRTERIEKVENAMARLETEESLILRWIYWEGLSYAQAARLANVSENSVGPLLSRAREHLRRRMKSE